MYKKYRAGFFLLLFIVSAVGTMAWWFLYNPVKSFTISVPGMDNRTKGSAITRKPVLIGSEFKFFKVSTDVPGTRWTRFRGPDFDNINKESIRLIDGWGKIGPKILWKMTLGEGHAAPAVYDGNIYLLDYDEAGKSDQLRCFKLSTGEELWRRGYQVHLKRNHGLSRTVPAVNAKFVLTIGPKCQVMCVDRMNGDFRWGIDLEKEYNTEVPFWYTGQCPLLDNDTAIIATGGKALLVAVDCSSGKKIWETPNPKGWKMSHSSVMPMTINGKKMYVYVAIGGVCGISASGADRGQVLWETEEFAPTVVAPSPVLLDDGKIFLTAGYGAGSALLKVTSRDGKFNVKVLQKYKPQEGLASEQQTPVYHNGYLFGILPKDAGGLRNQFACYRSDDCKTVVMSSGKTNRFGLGPYILADGKFFILNDDGEMTIANLSSSQFTVLGKARIIDGQDSWGPVVITGGYLIMRDSKQMVCMDIKAN
ncbi:MAG: PQQ-binding-like beta-propeller repeat protein [Bacteroidales bacterium]|nr:PQQ-binding-like beta-propeller repeat protein [Bacteroidales bacterium]